MTTDSAAPSVASRVQEFSNRVIKLAMQREQSALAAALRDEVRHLGVTDATIVVAGETSSGKSSLINALLGWPDLTPVDADVTTGVHLVIGHAPEPTAVVFRDDAPDGERIELDEVATWATERDNPRNEKRVRSVRLGIPHPLLARGVVLIDTPGVGGLEAAHTEVTLAALRQADALLFVTRASAELTGPEIDFLLAATERVDSVVFVVSQIDLFPGWRAIVERDQQILVAHAARFSESKVLPTSARYLGHWLNARDGAADADRIHQLSGFPRLEAEIERAILRRIHLIRLGNLVRLASTTLNRLRLPDLLQQEDVDPALVRGLEAEQQRMADLRRADASWPAELGDRFTMLQAALTTEMNRRLADVKRRFQGLAAEAPRSGFANLPADLDQALRAVWTELSGMLTYGVADIAAGQAQQLAFEWAPISSGAPQLPERLSTVAMRQGTPNLAATRRPDTLSDVTRLLYGVLPGLGLQTILAGTFLSPLALIAIPATFVLGASAVVFGRKRSTDLADRQAAISLLSDVIEDVRIEIPPVFQRELTAQRRALETAIRETIGARAREINAALKEREQTTKADAAQRRRRRDEAASRVAELRPLEVEADTLSRQLRRAVLVPRELSGARP